MDTNEKQTNQTSTAGAQEIPGISKFKPTQTRTNINSDKNVAEKYYLSAEKKIKGLDKKIKDLDEKIESAKGSFNSELKSQSFKNIEIIGIFSAILSFIIIDVNIVKSAESLYSAMVLMFSMALILSLFAVLIHKLFSPEEITLRKYICSQSIIILTISLFVVLILGILFPKSAFREDTVNKINDIKKCVNYSGSVDKKCFE